MSDLWHFAEEAFSVWQDLLYSPGETELQCGTQRIRGLAGMCVGAPGRLGAPSAVLSLCSRRSSLRATLGTFPRTGRDTSSSVPYLPQPPAHGGSAWSQLQAQGPSPGLPQPPQGHCSGSELRDKTKDKFLWQLHFPNKLGGMRRSRKIQTSLVHSVCLLRLIL